MSSETFHEKLSNAVGGIFLSGGMLAWTSNFVQFIADEAGTGSLGAEVAHYKDEKAFTIKLLLLTSFADFAGATWAFFAQPNEHSQVARIGKFSFPVPIRCEVTILSWANWKKEPYWAAIELQALIQAAAAETWPMVVFIDVSQAQQFPTPEEINKLKGQLNLACPVYLVNSMDRWQVREVFQNLINGLTS